MQHHLKNFYTKLAFKKFGKMSQLILQFRKYKNGKYKKIKLDWLHYRIVRSLTDKFIYKYEKIEEE